ncbi:ferredoxin [Nocardiopsis halotolerans]|uniref:ferredoxin n=1 Tax=Nocardiopsis halotolerans TaxID=124252 RepID=UPI0009FFE2DB
MPWSGATPACHSPPGSGTPTGRQAGSSVALLPYGSCGDPVREERGNEAEWSVWVDPLRCEGAGVCVSAAPGYFVLREGVSHPLNGRVFPSDDLLAAAQTCPVEAIRLPGITESPPRQTRAEPSTTSAEHEEQ